MAGQAGHGTWPESLLSTTSDCGPDCFRPTDRANEGELKARRAGLGAAYTTRQVGYHRKQEMEVS